MEDLDSKINYQDNQVRGSNVSVRQSDSINQNLDNPAIINLRKNEIEENLVKNPIYGNSQNFDDINNDIKDENGCKSFICLIFKSKF